MLPKGKRNPEKAEKNGGNDAGKPEHHGPDGTPQGAAEAAEREVNQ